MIRRGEVYEVDLGQPIGHEPAFRRPAVMVSTDLLNNGPGELVIIVPIGSTGYGLRSHIELSPIDGSLEHDSFARCDQVRVASTGRVRRKRGRVSSDELEQISRALRFLLEL